MENTPEVIEFDIRGQLCPSTLLTALKEINAYKGGLCAGAVQLRFKTDNRDCTVTIPDAATVMGYRVEVTRDQDHYVIVIAKGA